MKKFMIAFVALALTVAGVRPETAQAHSEQGAPLLVDTADLAVAIDKDGQRIVALSMPGGAMAILAQQIVPVEGLTPGQLVTVLTGGGSLSQQALAICGSGPRICAVQECPNGERRIVCKDQIPGTPPTLTCPIGALPLPACCPATPH